ncbi:hypothetical protein [Ectothiorhodospira shaposhnikovii]|uniref:hypothetical protein n=1 Tax=Ectothiorhodospira shaposhnikovii TaxID=1054 RepID=UPI001EE892B0|nr:hypothetical protein [Ectothiorhodospira shaposhnikovii]MCG5512818.1 hypothetical protein [Ectothiorhodospira shaposhnikovii]
MKMIVDGCNGIYIPKLFAERVESTCTGWRLGDLTITGLDDERMEENLVALRQGPRAPDYWEAWDEMVNALSFHNVAGCRMTLYPDGDLFLMSEDDVLMELDG